MFPTQLPSLAHCLIAGMLLSAQSLFAAPRLPSTDAEIVERLPSRPGDATANELAALRATWRRDPQNPQVAAALARRYVAQTGATGDPRYIGYAQAALSPWWDAPAPPPDLRVQRAILRQFEHAFDAALQDLLAVVDAMPAHAEAWSWIAAIQMVRADYPGARKACAALAPLTTPLIGVACGAYVEAMTGQASAAASALRRALELASNADPAQRLWAATRLAEIESQRGDFAASEVVFKSALALGIDDVYLLAAYADLLLARNRAAEVLALLKGHERPDVLLLRLAIAAKATGHTDAARWSQALGDRFAAAQARGDTSHRKEEARYALQVLGDAPRALTLARANYAQQREVADALLLLEAALAARQPEAAAPVLAWMRTSGVESLALHTLATRLEAVQ